jgi:hypothetical protein
MAPCPWLFRPQEYLSILWWSGWSDPRPEKFSWNPDLLTLDTPRPSQDSLTVLIDCLVSPGRSRVPGRRNPSNRLGIPHGWAGSVCQRWWQVSWKHGGFLVLHSETQCRCESCALHHSGSSLKPRQAQPESPNKVILFYKGKQASSWG